ncbi:hypothetical protein [Bradyrhizobium sp. Tv2a-2]|nr:hypothetical protein [Bradyrhizobium sp. Tv2a-2]
MIAQWIIGVYGSSWAIGVYIGILAVVSRLAVSAIKDPKGIDLRVRGIVH